MVLRGDSLTLFDLSIPALLHLAQMAQNVNAFTQFEPLSSEFQPKNLLNSKVLKLGVFLDLNCNESGVVLDKVRSRGFCNEYIYYLGYQFRPVQGDSLAIATIGWSTIDQRTFRGSERLNSISMPI